MPVKLITWNVHRGGHPNEQIPALLERKPDLIALQEIKASTVDDWRRGLERTNPKYPGHLRGR